MVRCSMLGCYNTSSNGKHKVTNISFFRFPKNQEQRDIWVAKCARTDQFNIVNARVCSIHFTEDQFEKNLRDFLMKSEIIRKFLKSDAIPNQNLPKLQKNTKSKNKREKRQKHRKQKQQLIIEVLEEDETPTTSFDFSTNDPLVEDETEILDEDEIDEPESSHRITELEQDLFFKSQENAKLLEENAILSKEIRRLKGRKTIRK